jgi:endonuclease G
MKKIFFPFLISISLLSYSQDDKYLPTNNGELIKHKNYLLSYIEKYEGAEWTCYELTPYELVDSAKRKTGEFIQDTLVSTGSANHSDYTKSGYDRGHLSPAADFKFSVEAMNESFFMSNVLPQAPELNRMTWKSLENDVRTYVEKHNVNLYIITGGIVFDKPYYIGIKNKIVVPIYFWKIIYDDTNNLIMVVVIPNNKDISVNYFNYTSTVDKVEHLNNVDFFPQLNDSAEFLLEKNIPQNNWLSK